MLTQPNKQNSVFLFIKKHQNFLSVAVIFLFALTVLRSAFYGISSPDETFYLSIPYRLIKGDALLVDEWHASQFSAFLLYLPMKLYLMINGNDDGMVLYFRCIFVLCQTFVSLYTYHKLRKYGSLAALVSAVIYLLYVPETVNMLDYYTMSLMGFQVTALTLFCSENLTAPKLIFSGIVFACVVVAQPFNCLIYFIYSVGIIIFCITKNKKNHSEFAKKYLSFKTWICLTIGIIAVAIIFIVFLFSQISFTQLIDNIGNLFGGHDHTLPFAKTGETDMFSYITIFKTLVNVAPIGFYVSVILIFTLLYDKKRIEKRNLWILIIFCVTLLMIIESCISTSKNFVAILFKPYILFVITFSCLMLTKQKDKKLFMIWFSGIIYTVFLGIISQALDYVGAVGFVISNTALMPALIQLFNELNSKSSSGNSAEYRKSPVIKILCCICILIISFDIISGTAIKFIDDTMAYGMERKITSVDTVLSQGPLKGIRTNNEVAKNYDNIIYDLKTIKDNSCEQVLVAGLIPWTYFCFDEPPATFTTWYIEEEFNLYEEYYKNPQKIPQCIYVPKINLYWGYDYTDISISHKEFFSQMFDVTEIEGNAGYLLYLNAME